MRNIYPVKYYSDEGSSSTRLSFTTRTWKRSSASIWNGMPISTSTRWRWSTTAP